jgi:chromate reductase
VGVTATLFIRMTDLPHFNPDDDPEVDSAAARRPLPPAVAHLRAEIGASQAVLVCTPEYAGGLPGSFKNVLNWRVGGAEMYGKQAPGSIRAKREMRHKRRPPGPSSQHAAVFRIY